MIEDNKFVIPFERLGTSTAKNNPYPFNSPIFAAYAYIIG